MRHFWKIAGIATFVAILGVAAVGVVVYAQDDGDGSGWPFDFAERFREALAGFLGITVEEYDAAVDKAREKVLDDAVSEGWLTEEQAELFQWRMGQAPCPGLHGFGMRGMDKGLGMFGRSRSFGGNNLISIAADRLEMSLTDLLTELQGGKTIADLADEKGVDAQTIVDEYVAGLSADLQEAVDEGRITRKQADWMLEKAKENATDQLDNTWGAMGHGGFRGGGRPGRMRGFPGQEIESSSS